MNSTAECGRNKQEEGMRKTSSARENLRNDPRMTKKGRYNTSESIYSPEVEKSEVGKNITWSGEQRKWRTEVTRAWLVDRDDGRLAAVHKRYEHRQTTSNAQIGIQMDGPKIER